MGDSTQAWAHYFSSMATVADSISASADSEAKNDRRNQEWGHQLLLAQQELKQVEQQQLAADIRQLITEKDLEIHEKNMDQADELHEFYKNKFTNLGLYNYLSTSLNRLYREAYNMAYDMVKMAEKTYQFERDDDTIFITGDNWQFDRAGLLAGERLILQLQHMERAYLEQNTRDYEVTQSFSLALLSPSALLDLRQKGSCSIEIPEIAFNLFYPGQYKRLIKSVRITIPCVTGPYTNVSATLTLNKSRIRKEASLDPDKLIPMPSQKSTSIATSNAQNDGGLFELNFRDERYLPFEGAGAISSWMLELPDKLRLFNYDTISDVIIHISYTARYDGVFREKVEEEITEELSEYAANNGSLLSMKHDFPDAFYKLLNPSGTTQTTEFELTKEHFPHFLVDKDLLLKEVKIYLKLKDKKAATATGPALKINGSQPIIWTDGSTDLKEGIISIPGSPIKKWTIEAGTGGLNKEEIDDILILLKYTIS